MADTLLILEDESLLANELARHFRRGGWEVVVADTVAGAEELLGESGLAPLVVIADMNLPDGNALDLLERTRERGVGGEWILLTAYGGVPESVRALRLGAIDFLEKPCPLDRLELVVAGAARGARAQRRIAEETRSLNRRYSPNAFLGASPVAADVRSLLARLAQVPFTALVISGETGTGKGLVTRILHSTGPRAPNPLIEVNCAALPQELLESELFGHEAGAFTGAKGRHRGLIEQAHGGTLFLDEISEMAVPLQSKLLKAIEDRRVRRLGGEREVAIDIQLIAASNRDLGRAVREGTFREDLYHRLSVFRLDLPPLRERISDLAQLVPFFIAELNAIAGRRVRRISDRAWRAMREYRWPGNVRELRNVLERSVLLSDGPSLADEWLQLSDPRQAAPPAASPDPGQSPLRVTLPLDGSLSLDRMEAEILRRALDLAGGNVAAAARRLGVTRQTLRYRLHKHGLRGEGASEDRT